MAMMNARLTAAAKAKPKPTPSPSTRAQKTDWTEAELQRLLNKGMTLDKARNQASKKYGIYPNGYTD